MELDVASITELGPQSAQGSWSFPCGIQILSAVVHQLYTARCGAAEAIRMLGFFDL